LLYDEAFLGFSSIDLVNTGSCFGAQKGFGLISEFLEHYDYISFYKPDGAIDFNDNGVQQTSVLDKYDLKHDNTLQVINKMVIYPTDVFAPLDFYCVPSALTKNTLSVHNYDASGFAEKYMKTRKTELNIYQTFWKKHCSHLEKQHE